MTFNEDLELKNEIKDTGENELNISKGKIS